MKLVLIGAQVPPGLEHFECTAIPDLAEAHFDNITETWTVTSSDGAQATAPVVVDARPSANQAVAHHGVPNYFRIPGPCGRQVRRQSRYVTRCLRVIERSGAVRVEAKRTIRRFHWGSVASRFYVTGSQPEHDDLYDGLATVAIAGESLQCRVRLVKHLSPIDGRTHWQGTATGLSSDRAGGGATLTIGDRTVPARIVERTPWGAHMIAGVGDPPFS